MESKAACVAAGQNSRVFSAPISTDLLELRSRRCHYFPFALVFVVALSCGQSTSTPNQPTPFAAGSLNPSPSAPPGTSVPAQLLGDWQLPTTAVDAAVGCHKPLVAASCWLTLTLTATTYAFSGPYPEGGGNVVVNDTEMDFFTSSSCAVNATFNGRYKWTLTSGVLHLTSLNDDPCARHSYLANQSFYRTL